MESMVIRNEYETCYRNKKVFLTGHTGFKGSWMLCWLQMLGAEVKGYSLKAEETSLYNEIHGDHLCQSIIADIRDQDKLRTEILEFQPDFIFHLAAQPLVRRSYDIPTETFEVNMLGTMYILDAVRYLHKPCAIILITTDKVYENKEWHYPYRESDRLGGYDPYSASKATAELVISSYRNSFFNLEQYNEHTKSIASARAGNVIGGGDWSKDRIIPDIVRSLQANVPIPVRNPKAIRPWQHVLEPVHGYLVLGAQMALNPVKFSESWNFGPFMEDALTVQELVETAIQVWGTGQYALVHNEAQPHEAGLLKLDISKTVNELKWKPKLNSQIGIQMTLDWFKCYLESREGIQELTKRQIEEYMQS
ncbi:CDP-glucose 4,6-dehydratase [Spirosoma aerolatum]|uniref:CDP-glucose 4,6-dehydratase n=1 Tax=Spirosoma aerolatum TaxID=1211326 RepID=UPI001FE7884E|nr:CDP-glucose 4,6-dehydratase [Spirosoma aerolatum]